MFKWLEVLLRCAKETVLIGHRLYNLEKWEREVKCERDRDFAEIKGALKEIRDTERQSHTRLHERIDALFEVVAGRKFPAGEKE